jgi:hypothetical protein
MRKYIFYFLIVLEVGGGFMGICAIIFKTQWSKSMPTSVWIFAIIAFFMFLIGIIAGLSFIERPRLGIALSALYQALQIPIFLSPLFSYKFIVGLLLGIGWTKGRFVMLIEPGASIKVTVFKSTVLSLIGVNILAVVLFAYLILQIRSKVKAVFPPRDNDQP